MALQELLNRETLDTIRSHARSGAYHRAMAARLTALGCPVTARQHTVSGTIAAGRLHHALQDAASLDAAIVQVAVMEGEAAGVDDADRELPDADAA